MRAVCILSLASLLFSHPLFYRPKLSVKITQPPAYQSIFFFILPPSCVLKMDHHCPWINNCVGYRNYGHFLRFILTVDIATLYVLVLLCWRTGAIMADIKHFRVSLQFNVYFLCSSLPNPDPNVLHKTFHSTAFHTTPVRCRTTDNRARFSGAQLCIGYPSALLRRGP